MKKFFGLFVAVMVIFGVFSNNSFSEELPRIKKYVFVDEMLVTEVQPIIKVIDGQVKKEEIATKIMPAPKLPEGVSRSEAESLWNKEKKEIIKKNCDKKYLSILNDVKTEKFCTMKIITGKATDAGVSISVAKKRDKKTITTKVDFPLLVVITGIFIFALLFRNPIALIEHGAINIAGITLIYAVVALVSHLTGSPAFGRFAGAAASIILFVIILKLYLSHLYHRWDNGVELPSAIFIAAVLAMWLAEWFGYALPAFYQLSHQARWEYIIFIFTWHLIIAAATIIFSATKK